MNKTYLHNFRWVVALVLIFTVGTTSGCETLRKKFTRRKKGEVVENPNAPILDPIDYPDKIKSAAQNYEEHYSLWKVWVSDLSSILEDNPNEKKVLYTLGQIKEQLAQMRSLLKKETGREMDSYLDQVDQLILEFKKEAAFRNKNAIVSQIHALSRNVRNRFSPEKIKDNLSSVL